MKRTPWAPAIFFVLSTIQLYAQTPPWGTPVNTGISHTISVPLSATPTINGTALVSGDYIGVFYTNGGTQVCGGLRKWDGSRAVSVPAWGDDPTTTSVKDGFSSGEKFQWRLWRASDGKEVTATASYAAVGSSGGLVTATDGFQSDGFSQLTSLAGTYPVDNPELEVSPTSWTAPAGGGTSGSIQVTNTGTGGAITYSVSDDADWITTSSTGGTTPGSFTISAEANNSGLVRNATVTVTATSPSGVEGSPKQVTVAQAANGESDRWVQVNTGLYVNSLANVNGRLLAGSWGSGVQVSTDNGKTWSSANTGLTDMWIHPLFSIGDTVFAGVAPYTDTGEHPVKVFSSTNGGKNWQPSSTGLTMGWVHSIIRVGNAIFAGGETVFRSTDNGVTWLQRGGSISLARELVTVGTDLFAGTSGGVYKSSDLGESWTSVSKGLTDLDIYSMGASGSILFAGTYRGVIFSSTDHGASWSPKITIPGPLPGVRCFKTVANTVLAGTDAGLFNSTDNGNSWYSANDGLTPDPYGGIAYGIYALETQGAVLIAGTPRGIWRRPLAGVVSVGGTGVSTLSGYSLGQNYPNPFNPSTTVQYTIPHRGHVTLAVYNTLGQEVAELVNGEIEAGHHQVQFNGRNLASGVYFYRLQAGEFVQTRSLVVLR